MKIQGLGFKILSFVILFFAIDFIISVFLLYGYKKYYGFGDSPEILINGSSMSMAGINRSTLANKTNLTVASYTQEGVNIYDRSIMVNHFLNMYPSGTEFVIYEINPIIFSGQVSAENVYTHFYPFLDDSIIDNYIKSNATVREYYIHKFIRTSRFDGRLIRLVGMGYLNRYQNIKTNILDSNAIKQLNEQKEQFEIDIDESKFEYFKGTMNSLVSNSANVILIMMPMYSAKIDTYKKDSYSQFRLRIMEYAEFTYGISFLDLSSDTIIYSSDYFSDPLHFNTKGQAYITDRIGNYINNLK